MFKVQLDFTGWILPKMAGGKWGVILFIGENNVVSFVVAVGT